MDIIRKANALRGKLFRTLTRNLGRSNAISYDNRDQIKDILICRPNHRLGNLLLITPLLQEIEFLFPHAKIHLFVKGKISPILFQHYQIQSLIQLPRKPFSDLPVYLKGWVQLLRRRYCLVINAVGHSSSGRIATRLVRARMKCYGDISTSTTQLYADHVHMAKYPVYNLRDAFGNTGLTDSTRKVPFLDLRLSKEELLQGKRLLGELTGNNKPTICLFTYATRDKCYPVEWWMEFCDRLLKSTSHNVIEVLPVENVSQLNFSLPSYYSKDLRMIGSLMANATLFIGADSGMMHLSSASRAPTIGLFQVTSPEIYEPYNPGSLGFDTRKNNLDKLMEIILERLNDPEPSYHPYARVV